MLTEPDPKLRNSARQALGHPWFSFNQILPTQLLPADQIKTPLETNIKPLSPGASPASRLISREIMAKNNGLFHEQEEDVGIEEKSSNKQAKVQNIITEIKTQKI